MMTVSFIFIYAMSWNITWNHLVRCSDSTSKYRCGQCQPPLTFNYLKWTKETGKSLSQQIKINKVKLVTSSTLRGEFLSSFILPVFCSGSWTQRPGHWTVGKDTHSKAKEPWVTLDHKPREVILESRRWFVSKQYSYYSHWGVYTCSAESAGHLTSTI